MRHRLAVFLTASSVLLLAFAFLVSPALSSAARSKTDEAKDVPPAAGLSHVRVVRLSFVEGTVTVRRPGSDEWASATVNTPIEEGFSVATGDKSFAEVQFENGSAVRLGELSSVDFTELALTALGGHVNHLTLDSGYASFRVIPDHQDEYLLNASGVTVTPQGKAEFRTDVDQNHLRVEVFAGEVQAADSNETEKLAKNHALTLDLNSGAPFEVSDKIQADDWDKWAAARDQQSTLASNDSAVGCVPRCTGGMTSTLTAIGAISRATVMAGRPTKALGGRPMLPGCGAGIPVGDTRGFRGSPGDGCRFIMGFGILTRRWDGSGCRIRSRPGIRRWSIGIPGLDGLAGRRSAGAGPAAGRRAPWRRRAV